MIRLTRVVAAILVTLHVCAAVSVASLRDDVQRLVRNANLKGATVAVSIRDADGGAALVSINADQPMIPASNMKLFTTGAALHVLGPDFEFTTRLLRDGDRLIVIGDGDPGLGDPELLSEMSIGGSQGVDVEAFINIWVRAVTEAGITQVSEIAVDDRIFDRQFVHPTWPADQLNRRYCAQVAGLNFHANVLHFFPKPRAGQTPVLGESRPAASWLKITNAATSRNGQRDRNDAWIARRLGTNELTFRGNVRFAYRTPVPVTIHDAPDFFAQMLADRLRAAGVRVGSHRVCDPQEPVSAGTVVGPLITTPLSTAITRCNRDSNNLYAECLLKRVGHQVTGEPGSWLNGGAIVRHIVHERLNDPKLTGSIVVADGSGLSRDNRITAAVMTAWLNSFSNDPHLGPMFIDSLAVGGESGTLAKRCRRENLYDAAVQAKTGYINGVSCLSGYVTMPDGRRRSFSILVNNLAPDALNNAKQLQDSIVKAIAEDLATMAVQLGSD